MLSTVVLLAAATLRQASAQSAPGPAEGQLQLVSKVDINGFATGALQVFVNGAYGAVCEVDFDNREADVACRQLGFISGVPLRSLEAPADNRDFLSTEFRADLRREVAAPLVLGNLGCTGAEERLIDCAAARDEGSGSDDYVFDESRGTPGCEPVFVACGMSSEAEEGDIRLVAPDGADTGDGTPASGLLEIFTRGAWGRVCAAMPRRGPAVTFTQQSAAVACRQLGFTSGVFEPEQFPLGLDYGGADDNNIDDDTWRIPVVLAGAQCEGGEAALTQCPGADLESQDIACELPDSVYISCITEAASGTSAAVRLAGGEAGPGYEYGRLEVFVNGTWGSVCDRASFSTASALVACRSLGYDGGAPLQFLQPYARRRNENQVLLGSLPPRLANVACVGTETSLLDCPARTDDITQCGFEAPGLTDATLVACGSSSGPAAGCPSPEPIEGSIRLRGGVGNPCESLHSGFVEVFHLGEWGLVGTGLRRRSTLLNLGADVACRQLGFPHGTAVTRSSVTPYVEGAPDAPVARTWLFNVACRGPEERLVDCDLGRGFEPTPVESFFDDPELVVCRQFAVEAAQENVTTPGAAEGDVRLAEETTSGAWVSGRLEVFFEGSWSQVCGLGFGGADAAVACRQLGLGAGTANTVRRSQRNGANVQVLELRGSEGVFPEVALTTVGCNGSEAALLECGGEDPFTGFRTRECREAPSAGLFISCVADPGEGEEGAVRLVNGTTGADFATGILEVFHAGAWGTICDAGRMPFPQIIERNYFDDRDTYLGITRATADVVCQQLGFDIGAFQEIEGGLRSTPPWLGNLECTGFEEAFTECDDVAFGDTHDCGDSQLRLACSTAGALDRLGEARLVGGRADAAEPPAWAYGLLDVHDGFIFGESCLSGAEAAVACRSLGFTTGAQLFTPGDLPALPEPTSEVTQIDDITCAGGEAGLSECDISGVNIDNDIVDKFQTLRRRDRKPQSCAVACSRPSGCGSGTPRAPPAQGDVRIVPVLAGVRATSTCDDIHFGAVELYNRGQWGRLCPGPPGPANTLDEFQRVSAVACRQLGFPFATPLSLTSANVAAASADIVWASEVTCTGVEERLDACVFPEATGNSSTGGLPAVAITGASCVENQQDRLAAVCRRFEVEGSAYIR